MPGPGRRRPAPTTRRRKPASPPLDAATSQTADTTEPDEGASDTSTEWVEEEFLRAKLEEFWEERVALSAASAAL